MSTEQDGGRGRPAHEGFPRPPVALTFIAPAEQCNQRCPACILDQAEEPVSRFDLTPGDYVAFVEHFVNSEVPILTLSFQGYEVTLPRSWPYLESVFSLAKRHRMRRSFVTNGMLLARFADRLDDLSPDRIAVSLDGASPPPNDRLRGLPGAFDATTRSVRRFLRAVPRLRDRVIVLSTLYDEENVRSLIEMPRLLRDMGVSQWMVSSGLQMSQDTAAPAHEIARLRTWFAQLRDAAAEEGVRFHVSDEFGLLEREDREQLSARRVFNLDFLYRLDPTGGIRVGSEILKPWKQSHVRQWHPSSDDAVEVSGYWEAAAAFE